MVHREIMQDILKKAQIPSGKHQIRSKAGVLRTDTMYVDYDEFCYVHVEIEDGIIRIEVFTPTVYADHPSPVRVSLCRQDALDTAANKTREMWNWIDSKVRRWS